MKQKASLKSRTENHLLSLGTMINRVQGLSTGHYTMNVLNNVIFGSKILYKLILIPVRFFDWQNGNVIRKLA